MKKKTVSNCLLWESHIWPNLKHISVTNWYLQMLQRSVNVNDVDGTTGMNMLHYAIRAVSLTGNVLVRLY